MMRIISSNKTLLVGIGLAFAYWILEAAIHTLVFHEGGFAANLCSTDPHEIWMRSLTACLLVAFGIYAQPAVNRRKRVEQALRESEERFHLAVRGFAHGLWDWDDSAGVTCWSPMYYGLLGYEDGEIEPDFDRLEEFLHPDDRKATMEAVRAHLEERMPYDVEYRLMTKSGEYRWFRARGQAIWDDDGKPTRMAGSLQNITERKRAEETLRFLSSVTEQVTDSIIVTNLDFEITYVNKATENLYGYPQEELIGKNPNVLNAAPSAKEIQQDICATVSSGKVWTGEHLNKRKDGSTFTCELRISPLVDELGQTSAYISVIRNVTERKLAEEALRKERDFSTSLVQASPTFFVGIGADGKTLMMNQAMLTSLGYTEDEVVGRDYLTTFVPDADHELLAQVFEKLVAANEPTLNENRVLTKDGRELLVEWHGTPIFKADGTFDFFFGVGIDITERKRAEEELAKYRDHLEELVEQRTCQLEESREQLRQSEQLAAVGTLAAGIAHEINNPVGMILLSAQNALNRKDDPAASEIQSRTLEKIIVNSKRCSQIVKSLLQFARQEPTEKWPNELAPLVERAVALTAKYAQDHGVLLDLDISGDLPAAELNPIEIEHVFVNLIRNAVEASSPKSCIKIRASAHEGLIRVSVQDDGPGMTEEQKNHLFEPFYTTRRQRGGTGLGLSIAHGIIVEHGGMIDVQSRLGEGTTIAVELPSKKGCANGREPNAKSTSS